MVPAPPETTAQLQCMGKGGPFKIVHVPKFALTPDQVLIRQHAIALNDLDRKQRDIGILVEHWPHVLGIEGAGRVEAVGSDVTNVRPGDEVMAWMAGMAHGEAWGGSFQERVVVPAYFVAKKPKNISIEEAASLPICYNTAVIAITQGLNVPLPFLAGTATSDNTPTSVAILGGSAATGGAAIQLLRLGYPALPILVTASPKHHARLASLGATKLFDRVSSSLVSDIKAASPEGEGVDMIIDCVGAGVLQKDICEAFDPAGSKLYSAVFTGVNVPVPDEVQKTNISGWSIFDVQGGKQIIPALTKLVEEGKYKLPVPVNVVGHGLAQLAEVIDKLENVSGEKLVVTL